MRYAPKPCCCLRPCSRSRIAAARGRSGETNSEAEMAALLDSGNASSSFVDAARESQGDAMARHATRRGAARDTSRRGTPHRRREMLLDSVLSGRGGTI